MSSAARRWLADQIEAGLLNADMLRAYQSNARVDGEAA